MIIYLKYLRNQHWVEGMVTTPLPHALYSETCWQDKGRTIQRFYRLASWTLLRAGERKKRKMLGVTPDYYLR